MTLAGDRPQDGDLDDRAAHVGWLFARLKRFVERYLGDATFRQRLRQSLNDPGAVAREYGIEIDLTQALPLFHPEYSCYRCTPQERRWPLAWIWDEHLRDVTCQAEQKREAGGCQQANPRFHAWRQRQIRRCDVELGPDARFNPYPMAAFELSVGCSVGCPFCGFSAEKLAAIFRYTPSSARLWREVLEQTRDLFGAAAQTATCYHATEPSDNPNYLTLIRDFECVVGRLPDTTTAVPLKDLTFTRALLELGGRHRIGGNRFSILSLGILDRIHRTFTPEELFNVELVLQNREALGAKVRAGRAREGRGPARVQAAGDCEPEPHFTIACVTGFVVNMVERSIRLVSPTRASNRWPLGYRIHGERKFETAREYRTGIEELIAAHMPDELRTTEMLRFRDDLGYARQGEGFELSGVASRHRLGGFMGAGLLGDLIHAGGRTAGEVLCEVTRSGADVFVVAKAIGDLFQAGLLDDDPHRSLAPDGGGREPSWSELSDPVTS